MVSEQNKFILKSDLIGRAAMKLENKNLLIGCVWNVMIVPFEQSFSGF